MRLTVVLTHPVQYYAPWFRYITASHPELNLTVLYGTQPTPAQQGVGFGKAFTWDIPLTEGYHCHVLRPARSTDNVHSDRFWGLNIPEIVTAVDESCPNVLLVNGWYSVTLVRALLASRRRRVPVLYRGDTHLGNAPSGSLKRASWNLKTRFLLSMFNGYLSVGQRNREYLRRFGAPEARIFDVPHCVDNDFFADSAKPHQTPSGRASARSSFGLAADDFVVLFVGKLEAKKRPLDLIRAAAHMSKDVIILIAGSGPLERACRDEADKLGVRVKWAGFLNQSEIGRAYAVADCLVLPSDWGETWGLVVNEALATGLPCIVSDRVGCAPDLISEGKTGFTYPIGDIVSLAACIRQVRNSLIAGNDWMGQCQEVAAAYSFAAASAGLSKAVETVSKKQNQI